MLVLTFVLIFGLVCGQELTNDTKDALIDLFPTSKPTTTKCPPGQLCIPDLIAVTSSTTESSISATDKCGEGKTKGKRLCVNYEYCDPETDTIVQNGLTAGFGVIDIRFGENRCSHPLEVCCQIPKGGLSPGFDPSAKPSTTTPSPTSSARPPNGTSARPPNGTSARPPNGTSARPPSTPNGCGRRNANGIDFKMTGNRNNEAEYGEFPWMVAIVKRNSYTAAETISFSFCGGSLISLSVVLTGAHCVFNYAANEIMIRAGEWDSKTTRERLPYQERTVTNIITHRDFVRVGVFNDFALLILDTPLEKTEHIGTVCLPDQGLVIQSSNCFVSGWGKNVFGSAGKYQDILKKIELPIVPVAQCQSALRQTRLGPSFILHDSFLCAGGEKGKDACTGDGGSPLVCPDPRNPSRYLLVGMVAWGIGCGELNLPGVYADVAKFRSWIDDQMRRENLDIDPYIS